MRLGASSAATTLRGFFSQRFCGLISLSWSPGLRGLFRSPNIPPDLSMRECGATGSASCRTACPVCPTIRHISGSGCSNAIPRPRPPLCAPPTGLDECFFSTSLVVGLPCGSISVTSGCCFFNCCCPTFGCARRHSVSTYTSILVFPYSRIFRCYYRGLTISVSNDWCAAVCAIPHSESFLCSLLFQPFRFLLHIL